MDKMKLYNCLPVQGQNIACSIEGYRINRTRYGNLFWKYLSEYENRSVWKYEKLCEYRDKRLKRMVKYCYAFVPYYKDLFNEAGINPESIRYLDDLKKLPILTKDMVNSRPEKFLSEIYPKTNIITQHTSGTTGTGFIFKSTKKAVCEQWAVWWRYRRQLGIKYGTWCGLFGGRSVVPAGQKHPPFYRVNKPGRQIYFSAYHMNESNLFYYIEALERYKPVWIHGYPSSIALLAQYMVDNNRFLSYQVKWITTGAENLMEQQKNAIQKAFGVSPYEHYGMMEGAANISQDKLHRFIIDEDYAAVEFVQDKSSNDSYQIVGTCLTNYAMPLIRYLVGDNVALLSAAERKVISIDGRKEDYLILSNGTVIGRLDHIFKDMINVKEAQIYQNRQGNITFRVVRGKRYRIEDENRLKKEIKERLGNEPYQLSYIEKVDRAKSGKVRFVISERAEAYVR